MLLICTCMLLKEYPVQMRQMSKPFIIHFEVLDVQLFNDFRVFCFRYSGGIWISGSKCLINLLAVWTANKLFLIVGLFKISLQRQGTANKLFLISWYPLTYSLQFIAYTILFDHLTHINYFLPNTKQKLISLQRFATG